MMMTSILHRHLRRRRIELRISPADHLRRNSFSAIRIITRAMELAHQCHLLQEVMAAISRHRL